ncbi:MAG: BMP family ABC transporter substrate-binding protein [Lachnospiraceae bacterium]|nr:BMP family ABC transporter substrate-binding protein [Lachnospiraceae bacterium]
MIMKKLVALAMSALMAISLSGAAFAAETEGDVVIPEDFKAGFIFLHDENSTYDLNFINAAKEAAANLGMSEDQIVLKTNVPEGQECYEEAMDMADQGCGIVFADSFGHEDYMIQAAQEVPEVQFCHATGTKAHTQGLDNYHNAFASIYEGRFLAGVAAGMKLNEMIANGDITEEEAKVGYVGAFTYAEVISGFTSFFLGVRHECPSATMEVTFTGSWYDETAEKEGANTLIEDGCVLISQHADSMGAPTACEAAGVPDVSYNGSTKDAAPNTYIISSKINWAPYFEHAIKCAVAGEPIEVDYTGTLATDSVQLTELNEAVAAEGTAEEIEAVKAALEDGSLHVFDTSAFTVFGEALTEEFMADVDDDPDYAPDTAVVSDGYFHESEFRSAPYFGLFYDESGNGSPIDGITLLDTAF